MPRRTGAMRARLALLLHVFAHEELLGRNAVLRGEAGTVNPVLCTQTVDVARLLRRQVNLDDPALAIGFFVHHVVFLLLRQGGCPDAYWLFINTVSIQRCALPI